MKSNIYFVLYLVVVLEILVVILDRDDAEENLLREMTELANEVVKPLPSDIQVLRLPEFTVNQSIVQTASPSISELIIKGLRGDTTGIDVSIDSTHFCENNKANALSNEQILDLEKSGRFHQVQLKEAPTLKSLRDQNRPDPSDSQLVLAPIEISAQGKKVGIYRYDLNVRSDRVHFLRREGEGGVDSVRFGKKFTFSYDLVLAFTGARNPGEIIEKYSTGTIVLYVTVGRESEPVRQFRLAVVDPPREWAIGNELSIPIAIEGVRAQQVLSITSSPVGYCEPSEDRATWVWRGTLPDRDGEAYRQEISLYGGDNRHLGTLSSAETRFHVTAIPPTLDKPNEIPADICQSEPFAVNMNVKGLTNTLSYELRLYRNGVEDPSARVTGSADHRFYLPDVAVGTMVTLEAWYDGRVVFYYGPGGLEPLRRSWTVKEKPVRIHHGWSSTVGITGRLKFYGYLACDEDCPDCHSPLLVVPTVRMFAGGRDVTSTYLGEVVRLGEETFEIRFRRAQISRGGASVTIEISYDGKPVLSQPVILTY
jgi:hypothetical protein